MSPRERIGHPAPNRGRVALIWLWAAVIAAPAFWFAQEWLNYGFSSYTCYPGDTPLAKVPPGWNWVRTGMFVFDAAAIIATLIGGYVAWRCWIATRAEKPGGAAAALELGEGRTRFLALWGLMFSAGFLLVIIFETIASIMAPLCGGVT